MAAGDNLHVGMGESISQRQWLGQGRPHAVRDDMALVFGTGRRTGLGLTRPRLRPQLRPNSGDTSTPDRLDSQTRGEAVRPSARATAWTARREERQ